MMALSLCAMVMTVESTNSVHMVFWMRSLVSRSTAAVASSNTRILVLWRRAQVRHTSWRWPTLEGKKLNEEKLYHDHSHLHEVVPALCHLMLQALLQTRHKSAEVGTLQRWPYLLVSLCVKGVKVHPESPREQNWVLRNKQTINGFYLNTLMWYDGDPIPEVVQIKHSNVDIVNEDGASSRLNDPEQSQGEWRLASSSTDPLYQPRESERILH